MPTVCATKSAQGLSGRYLSQWWYLSDNGDLMERFLNLPALEIFMYGDQSAFLSYLDHIDTSGVRRCEIPQSGTFRCILILQKCGKRLQP